MEETLHSLGLLDLMIQPGFYVEQDKITAVNSAAEGLLLSPGMDILPLICSGLSEYQSFREGCLYLQLRLSGKIFGASVTRQEERCIFLLDPEDNESVLQALSLAARELRKPISAMITGIESSPELQAKLDRSCHQLLRLVNNMADAGHAYPASRQETTNITAFFSELFEKAACLAECSSITVTYCGPRTPIYCLADRELLERAVYNLLSNSLKFTPAGGQIDASLTRHGKTLRLTIQDGGPGFARNMIGSAFRRYLRQPCIEESRIGLGLGMVLVRTAAASHGGAVLIDQPEGCGARVTVTLSMRQNPPGILHSPIRRVDYTGERDHALVELSDVLPADLYQEL